MTKQFDVKLNTQREQVDFAREGCHVKIHALSTDSQVEKFVDDVKEYINE